MTIHVDLLSPPANYAVVQLPDRSFPGVVVQGDTLHELVKDLRAMADLLKAGRLEDLEAEIGYVRDQLSEALSHYEQVCDARGVAVPYSKT